MSAYITLFHSLLCRRRHVRELKRERKKDKTCMNFELIFIIMPSSPLLFILLCDWEVSQRVEDSLVFALLSRAEDKKAKEEKKMQKWQNVLLALARFSYFSLPNSTRLSSTWRLKLAAGTPKPTRQYSFEFRVSLLCMEKYGFYSQVKNCIIFHFTFKRNSPRKIFSSCLWLIHNIAKSEMGLRGGVRWGLETNVIFLFYLNLSPVFCVARFSSILEWFTN